jgi:mevalonate kinase
MRFTSSAPCKAILFGEHYVVYGSYALSVAIEPRNSVKFSDAPPGGRSIVLNSIYGTGRISQDCDYTGPNELELFSAVAKTVFATQAVAPCSVEFVSAWKLKGVGTSASLCAAFAAGLLKLAGKKATPEEIFSAAQAGDLVAHGGRASGIDAKTVSEGCAMSFRRNFSPPSYDFKPLKLNLPSGTSLLLIDTFAGKKSTTSEMVALFAKSFGIAKAPQELAEEERANVREEYEEIWHALQAVLKEGNAKKIGALMNDNHALLRKRGVSSRGIDFAVATALEAGAWGAKMTAAGGEGGAAIALCEKKNEKKMQNAIADATGFAAYPVSLAKKGACTD